MFITFTFLMKQEHSYFFSLHWLSESSQSVIDMITILMTCFMAAVTLFKLFLTETLMWHFWLGLRAIHHWNLFIIAHMLVNTKVSEPIHNWRLAISATHNSYHVLGFERILLSCVVFYGMVSCKFLLIPNDNVRQDFTQTFPCVHVLNPLWMTLSRKLDYSVLTHTVEDDWASIWELARIWIIGYYLLLLLYQTYKALFSYIKPVQKCCT